MRTSQPSEAFGWKRGGGAKGWQIEPLRGVKERERRCVSEKKRSYSKVRLRVKAAFQVSWSRLTIEQSDWNVAEVGQRWLEDLLKGYLEEGSVDGEARRSTC